MANGRGLKRWRNLGGGCPGRGLPQFLSPHIGLRREMSSVKLGECSELLSPVGSTEGAFVHHHLAPITARQNSSSAAGRRVNGPGWV